MNIKIENSKNVKTTKMDAYINWFTKWVPESFFICLALTILCSVLAMILCKTPFWSMKPGAVNIVDSWVGGFWGLLAFTMQMTLLLVTGNAVAASPPAKRVLSKIASIPKNAVQVVIVGAVGAAVLGYIHWGIGMMGGIMLGRELLASAKKRGIKVHKATLVTAIFLSFMPGSAGISGAAALYAATPGYLKNLVADQYKNLTPNTISLSQSVANPAFIVTLILGVVVCTSICLIMAPKKDDKIEEISDKFMNEVLNNDDDFKFDRSTPALKMNNSRMIMYIFGGIGLIWSVFNLAKVGLDGLTLNNYNFLMLSLGMILCGNPELFCKNIREGLMGTWGFVIQFPFYAGIFGIISSTGLGVVIAHFFISISNGKTFPIIAYIYSAILNIAVPSGGSKFVIEAPYIIPASIETGANLPAVISAYQLGDGTTNVIIPFFALPYLANFDLKFNKVIPYSLIAAVAVFVVNCLMLYFIV